MTSAWKDPRGQEMDEFAIVRKVKNVQTQRIAALMDNGGRIEPTH